MVFNPKPRYSVPSGQYNEPNHWGYFLNGGRDWTVANNLAVDTPLFYESGAGITWNDEMQDNQGDYYQQMKDEAYTKPPYSKRYPKLAALDDYYSKKGKPACNTRETCPAAPWGVSVKSNVGVNATPTKHVEQQPLVLCAQAEKAGNGDPNCKGFPDANTDVADNAFPASVAQAGFQAADPRAQLDFAFAAGASVPAGWAPLPLASVGPHGCCAGGCAAC